MIGMFRVISSRALLRFAALSWLTLLPGLAQAGVAATNPLSRCRAHSTRCCSTSRAPATGWSRWASAPCALFRRLGAQLDTGKGAGVGIAHGRVVRRCEEGLGRGARWHDHHDQRRRRELELQRDGIAAQEAINRESLDAARRAAAAAQGAGAPDADEAQAALEKAEDRASQPVYAPPLMDVGSRTQTTALRSAPTATTCTPATAAQLDHDEARIDNPDDLHYYAIASGGAGRLLIRRRIGSMFRSRDGGASWEALSTPTRHPVRCARLHARRHRVRFGLQGTVLVSQDFGDTWRRSTAPPSRCWPAAR